LKLIPDGVNSGGKKCNRGFYGAFGDILRILHLAGVWNQAIGFVLAVKAFSHLIYFFRKCFNGTISSITVEHRKFYSLQFCRAIGYYDNK
jgi:hypothetical protein